MENRNNFAFFIEETRRVSEPVLTTFFVEKGDLFFVGKEIRIDDHKITYYLLPFSDGTATVLIKLADDEPFDSFIENIDEYNIDGCQNAWPYLMEAMYNGANDNYSSPALIKLNDLFWGLCLQAENVSIEDLDSDYIFGKVGTLIDYAEAMIEQIDQNEVSGWDKAWEFGGRFFDFLSLGSDIGSTLFGALGLDDDD